MPQLGLTFCQAAQPGATGADPGPNLQDPRQPTPRPHIMIILCPFYETLLPSTSSALARLTQNSLRYSSNGPQIIRGCKFEVSDTVWCHMMFYSCDLVVE